MFEKFTESAIKIIMVGQEEARRMGHSFVGTEQLLLGVIGQRHGIGAKAIRKATDVTLGTARREIELYIGRGNGFMSSEVPFTPRAKRVLEMAVQESKDLGQGYVSTEHILLALIAETDGVAMRTLDKLGVNFIKLRQTIFEEIALAQEKMLRPLSQAEKYLLDRERFGTSTPTVDEFSENVTALAMDGKLDPVVGRDQEIEDMAVALGRRGKNNPVLVGEPGVGKTAIVEGLAQYILSEESPNFLKGRTIMALDLSSILAGTKYRGEFEDRFKRVIEEVERDTSVLIFIDEIHTIIGAGAAEGAVDAANMLKPALARRKFRCMGATTVDEYRKYIERDSALERRFQRINVNPPTIEAAISILRGLRREFEDYHGIIYDSKAVEQAVILSDQYIPDRYLPDKAIDVLDEAASRVRVRNSKLPEGYLALLSELKGTIKDKENAFKTRDYNIGEQLLTHEKQIRAHLRIMLLAEEVERVRNLGNFSREEIEMVQVSDIEDVISRRTGIPINKLSSQEAERLLHMESILRERLIGQDHAIKSVSNAMRRARSGFRDIRRPIASFIFAGPTGVGKTELTKTLADFMFSSEEHLLRLDMSEYMEKHNVAKLIGAPPGYVGYSEGGILTEAVRKRPYTLVLFDEVEKAHSDVFNLLLQILDDGHLTDSKAQRIDFRHSLIIMTTNLGAQIIEKESGIRPRIDPDHPNGGYRTKPDEYDNWEPKPERIKTTEDEIHLRRLVTDELKIFFRPEFLNRLDEVIIFEHLTKIDLWNICGILINSLSKRLEEQRDIIIEIDDSVKAFLTDAGYDPIYGARPLRRAIVTHIEDLIVFTLLGQPILPNTRIIIHRKKIDIFEFSNELEVELDLSEVIIRPDIDRVRPHEDAVRPPMNPDPDSKETPDEDEDEDETTN